MKTSLLFADKFRYWPFRLFSEAWIRKFFAKKAGLESGAFIYSNDLAKFRRRIVFLPKELGLLSVYIPFILELSRSAQNQELVLVCEDTYQPLLKALGIEKFGWYYSAANFRYGDPHFKLQEARLRKQEFDVAIMLDSSPSLLQLYLIRASGAALRIGMDCEPEYPFLNFCYRPNKKSPYAFRTYLQSLFQLTDSSQDHPLVHKSTNLSSQHVILLNLEPSVDGRAWTAEEMADLARRIDPHFRLLALAPDPSLLDLWNPTLEQLAIRSAPIATSFHAFLDLLRQYKGMVSLNSAHAQLALNISRIPLILVHDPKLEGWLPESNPAWQSVVRGNPIQASFFDFLTS